MALRNKNPNGAKFGMISIGATPDVVRQQSQLLSGVKDWYSYDSGFVPIQGLNQIYLVKMGLTNDQFYQEWMTILENARSSGQPVGPGSLWILGNEPNNLGQDGQPPSDYAYQLNKTVQVIKSIDPTAIIAGPAILNWSADCVGVGPGFTLGKDWFDQMIKSYRSQFPGQPIPLDRIMIHTSKVDWTNLPMIDPTQDINQIRQLRQYRDLDPELRNKPIWVEFAILFGYPGFEYVPTSNGTVGIKPTGTYCADQVKNYINQLVGFMARYSSLLNIEKWFPYVNFGTPEPYDNGVYTGFSLFTTNDQGGTLTDFGRLYNQLRTSL